MAKLPDTKFPALQKFILKGITSKDSVHDALSDLRELIDDLENLHGEMDDALVQWDEGEDRDERAEGKERLEEIVTSLDEPLSEAGYCAGQKPYEPKD